MFCVIAWAAGLWLAQSAPARSPQADSARSEARSSSNAARFDVAPALLASGESAKAQRTLIAARPVGDPRGTGEDRAVRLCQVSEPFHRGPHSRSPDFPNAGRVLPGSPFGQGTYVSPDRFAHVPEYRLRVDDLLEFVYRETRDETSRPYQLNVGDEIRVESLTDSKLNRDLVVQPDGTITLLLLGQVRATRRTVEQLRQEVEQRYRRFYNQPAITITPLKVNTKLRDILATVDARFGVGGQVRLARVTPDGTIALPAIGSVSVQGLTLEEARREINERYALEVEGLEITPILNQRAPRFVYVLGEVRTPGRFELTGPTTVMQAIALAGSFTGVGANLHQVVVFRRDATWGMLATKLDLYEPLVGGKTRCVDEIWVADSDVIVVPKTGFLVADEYIEQIFTRGIYGVMPFQGISLNFAKLSTL
jgi:polysaccharide export outer membrane protein